MDPTDTFASLRPGMPQSAYAVANWPKPEIESTGYDTEGRWPPRRRYAFDWGSISVDHLGIIEAIGFGGSFPHSDRVAGLHLGMIWEAAHTLYPELRLTSDTGAIQFYSGATTPDGFELNVNCKGGFIHSFGLARPGMAQYLADYYAFIRQKKAEYEAGRDAEAARRNGWRKIADSQGMLREWAKYCQPWDNVPNHYVAYAEWLIKATPDERHAAATNWNWDYGTPPMLYIIRQPDCDLATALEVFYLAEPTYYRKFDEDPTDKSFKDDDVYDLIKEIRSRVNAGAYTRREIAFDGTSIFDKRFGEGAPFVDKTAFRVKLAGRVAPELDFDDGIPSDALTDVPGSSEN